MVMLTLVKVNSIDVTSSLISYERDAAYGDAIAQVDFKFLKTINDLVTLTNGQRVEIWRGWTTSTDEKVFDGYIESYQPEAGTLKLTAKDKLWDLVRKEVTHTYDETIDASAGVYSEIFKDLVTTYGGLTADGTTIQSSGTAKTIQKFVCNHTDIFERCKKIAEALDWQFYYRADTDKVYFEPKGFTSNGNTLTVGDNIFNVPKWNYDVTEMANDVTIVGAYQEIETTESGRIGTTTGYTTAEIALSFEPISVKMYMDASNPPTTLKVGGLPDSTATFDYYVDKTQKKLFPKDGTTFTSSHYAEIRYSHAVPIPVHMYTDSSITTYGQFKKTVTYKDLRSVADAESRGTDYLTRYSTPFIYTTLKVKNDSTLGLNVGQLITIVDNINSPSVNRTLVINRHRIRYPADYDEIEVGDKIWRLAEWQSSVEERLKRIMEEELANQDIVVEILSFDNTSLPIEFKNRYIQLQTQTYNNTNARMIWDNSDHGVWDTNKWGDGTDTFNAVTNTFISQYLNTYTETFIDTDFKDATSTATWTTSGSCTFTNGQIALSTPIDFNNGTITTATLTSDSTTNLTFKLSADGGSNFETVTSGVTHTFTHTGTSLIWKATASGNATLTSITIGGYH